MARTPGRGTARVERLDDAQAYLDRWERRCANTGIHGTTKRQVVRAHPIVPPMVTETLVTSITEGRSSMLTTTTMIDPERERLGEVELIGRDRWEEIVGRTKGASIRADCS